MTKLKCIGGPLHGACIPENGWFSGEYHKRTLWEWPTEPCVYVHQSFSDPVHCGQDHFNKEIAEYLFHDLDNTR